MDINGFLTLVGLGVAAYSLLPRYRRLELKIKWNWLDWLLLLGGLLAFHLIQFYLFFNSVGFVPNWPLGRWGIDPGRASYLAVLAAGILIFIHIRTTRISPCNVVRFRDLVEELMGQGNSAELLAVLGVNLQSLLRVYKADFPCARLRGAMLQPSKELGLQRVLQNIAERARAEENARDAAGAREQPSGRIRLLLEKIRPVWASLLQRLASFMPAYENEQGVAADIFRITLLRRPFASELIRLNPYFALRIMDLNIAEREEFIDNYFRALVIDQNSILYFEVKNNQNLVAGADHRYILHESNKLLRYLFADANVAKKLKVWRPVGEQVIAELETMGQVSSEDPYNLIMGDFDERGRWESPIYCGIRFFDTMVSEAIYQNIDWHMWLYYFPHFVKAMCQNFRPGAGINLNAEFPIRYAYLLYDTLDTLRSWIKTLEDLPQDQSNAQLRSSGVDHENGNPIKSSILAMTMCLRTIALADNLPAKLRRYLIGTVFGLYFDLRAGNDRARNYADALRNALLVGGPGGEYSRRPNYLGRVISSLVEHDNIPYDRAAVDNLVEVLSRRFLTDNDNDVDALAQYVQVHRTNSRLTLSSQRGYAYRIQI